MRKNYRLHCETCGGSLDYAADGRSAVCPYCGNEYHFRESRGDALVLSLNRAHALRQNNDFDGAATEYKLVAESDPQCAEAWWGLALCTYGVEYIEDPRTHRRVPVCRRTVKKSILEDENYLNALRTAAEEQCEAYRTRAAAIDALQNGIKRRLEEEEDYDVFLCFRAEDDAGTPTRERAVALELYGAFSSRGIRTFCSEVTLRGRLGEDYEPLIYKALYSCRVFILIAMREENIGSAWVRSEWSRFCDRVYEERLTGACFAVFDGISPASLPSFLRAQGVDLSKYPQGGYAEEIADSLAQKLGKVTEGAALSSAAGAAAEGAEESGGQAAGALAALLAEGKRALRAGDFVCAAAAFSRAIEEDAESADAWLGAFLADIEVCGLGRGTAFARTVCDRLYSYGATAAECRERLARNERQTAAVSSPYYKNALRLAHGRVMDQLVAGKQQIMDESAACNAALRDCLRRCEREEAARPENTRPPQNGGVSAGTVAGTAAAAGLFGWMLGRSRRPRPPRPPRRPPRGRW